MAAQGDPTESKELEVLCRQAGTMLLKSPNVAAQLSGAVHAHTRPDWRWYEFLKDTSGLSRLDHGVAMEDGKPVETVFFGELSDLKSKSARACIECATAEI